MAIMWYPDERTSVWTCLYPHQAWVAGGKERAKIWTSPGTTSAYSHWRCEEGAVANWIPFIGLLLGVVGTGLLVHLLQELEREGAPRAESQPRPGPRSRRPETRPSTLAKAA